MNIYNSNVNEKTMKHLGLFNDGNERNEQRLIERQKRIIDANLDAVDGKVVFDLAANNGRWSYAAIAAGASEVVSIEGRGDRANEAKAFFKEIGIADKVDVNIGEMHNWLFDNKDRRVDTVFCLGIYYHVMNHYMLLQQLAALKPQTIIVDSGFVRSFRNSVHVQSEDPGLHRNALKVHEGQKSEFAGFVSLGLMIQMSWNLGFNCRPVLWDPAEINFKDTVQDYLMGRRFTLRLDKMDEFENVDWKDEWREALHKLNPRFLDLLERETHDSAVDNRITQPFESMDYTVM